MTMSSNTNYPLLSKDQAERTEKRLKEEQKRWKKRMKRLMKKLKRKND